MLEGELGSATATTDVGAGGADVGSTGADVGSVGGAVSDGVGTADTASTATLTDEQILGITDEGIAPPEVDQPQTQLGKQQDAQPQDLPTGAAPPDWLKALYADPKIGRQAQQLWDQTAAYRGVWPTVAEAKQVREIVDQVGGLDGVKEALEGAQRADQTDAAFFSGDPAQQATVVSEMFEEDRDAFESGLNVSLDVIKQSDPSRYARITNDLIGNSLKSERFDDHMEMLRELAEAGPDAVPQLLEAVKTLVNWADNKKLSAKQDRTELDPQRQQLRTETQRLEQQQTEFRQQQFNGLREAVHSQVTTSLKQQVGGVLNQLLPKVSQGIRDRIGKQVIDEIDQAMQADKALTQKFVQLVHPSKTQFRFDRSTQDQATQLLLNRAKQLVANSARKVVTEWTKDVVNNNRTTNIKTGMQATRQDISGGAPIGAGGKKPLTKEEASKMTDEQILNW